MKENVGIFRTHKRNYFAQHVVNMELAPKGGREKAINLDGFKSELDKFVERRRRKYSQGDREW